MQERRDEDRRLKQAEKVALKLRRANELIDIDKIKYAETVAIKLLGLAEEKATKVLMDNNLDITKVALICNKIVVIQGDISWLKWLIGAVLLSVLSLAWLIISKGVVK